MPEAQADAGMSLKHDIALPLPQLEAFMRHAEAEMTARFPQLTPIVYGHAGDGNLHWNLQATVPMLPDQDRVSAEVRRRLYDLVGEFGGSFSAEHGVGRAYRDHLRVRVAADRVRAMKLLKTPVLRPLVLRQV